MNGLRREPMFIRDIGFESRMCPRRQVTPRSWHLLDLFNHYRNGHLPEPGSISDQPAYLMRAFSTIETRLKKNEAQQTRGKNAKKTPRRV